jgi:two-component system, chemotaxis family, sensor kinase CheA
MSLDNEKMIEEFVTESLEHLSDVENDLLAIEEAGANIDAEIVNKVFRAVHSIKGAAGFLGLTTINDLAHSLENVLNLVRSKELVPTAAVVDALLRAVDALRGLLNNVNTSNGQDVWSHINTLKQIITGQTTPEVSASMERNVTVGESATAMFEVSEHQLATHQRLGNQLFILDFDLITDVEERGKTPLSLVKDLLAIGEVVEARFDPFNLGDLSSGVPDKVRFVALIGTVVDTEMLAAEFSLPQDRIHALSRPAAPQPAVLTPAPAAAPAPVAPAPAPVQPEPVLAPSPAAISSAIEDPAKASEASKSMAENSIRVSVGLLDHLMNLAGELVLSRNQLMQIVSNKENRNIESISARLDQVTSELQEAIMQTRMQPIGTVFNKFPRIVRDLSGKLNKQCDLIIEGKDVELDKSIIETIGDPLTHLIRNSVDHGIEMPQARSSKGKNPTGHITLRAFHQAGKVNIAITDDGAGIDPAKLKAKAVSKGLISTERAREMTDREAVALIFLPGFSTAEKVTDVSGRGVGMDVVRTNIERLGGTVEIESRIDAGTTIKVTLPLTLAIIPSLIVRCGEERFAVPQVNINELVRIKASEVNTRIERIKGAEVLRLRGNLLPLVRLSTALGIQSKYLDPVHKSLKDNERESLAVEGDDGSAAQAKDSSGAERRRDTSAGALNIIVVETGHLRYGVIVDGLHDSEEIVVKPLGRHMKGVRCLAGATILGDGHVALILDITGIAMQCSLEVPEGTTAASRAEEAARSSAERQTALLFTNDPSEQFGVTMNLISRIERIRSDQIDSVGGQEVLQYRGASLPLLSLDKLIKAKPRPEQAQMYVIVFRLIGQRQEIGLVAPNLVDIREISTDVEVVTFREPGVLGSLVIDDKTTRLIDLSEMARAAHGEWFSEAERAEVIQAAGGRRVLFAEDSAFFRKQVSGFLTESGYEVEACEDGLVAWNAIQNSEQPFDLVVTDIEMPNVDGYELTRRIKGDKRFSHLPVIAVTSLAGQENIQKGAEVGIDDYQIKLDRDQLIAAVARLCGRAVEAVAGRKA